MNAVHNIHTHLNLNGNEVRNVRLGGLPSDPDPVEGGVYFNLETGEFRFSDGTAWKSLLGGFWKLDDDGNLVTDKTVIVPNLIVRGDLSTDAKGSDQGAAGGIIGVKVGDAEYTDITAGILDMTDAFKDLDVDLSDYYTKDETVDLLNTAIAGIDLSGYASKSDVNKAIADLINGAPETLDTLKEVADALAENADVVDALNAAIGNKAGKATTLAGYGITDAYTKVNVDDLLKKYLLLEAESQTIKGNIRIEGNLIIAGDMSSEGTGGNSGADGTVIGVVVNGTQYADETNGMLDLSSLMNQYALTTAIPTTLPASDVYPWAKKSSLALADVPDLSSKYLSVNGGTINGTTTSPLKINTTATDENGINFLVSGVSKAWIGYSSSTGAYIYEGNSGQYICIKNGTPYYGPTSSLKTIIHSGNIGSYAPTYDASNNVTLKGTHLYAPNYIFMKSGSEGIYFSRDAISWHNASNAWVRDLVVFGSNGNVLIGTATDSGYKLDVAGTGRFTGAVTMESTLSVGGNIGFSKGFAYNLGTNASPASILYTTAIRCAVNGTLSLGNDNGLWAQFAASGALTVHKDTTINGNLSIADALNSTHASGLDITACNGAAAARVYLTIGAFRPWYADDGLVDLGISSVRWKGLYCKTGDFSGNLVVSGNVLIGTTTDSGEKLQIRTSTWDGGLAINRTVSGGGASIAIYSNGTKIGCFGIDGSKWFEVANTSDTRFWVDTATGKTTIGATSLQSSYMLYANGDSYIQGTLGVSGAVTMSSTLTVSQKLQCNRPILGYIYSYNTNAAAFIFDKPGINYTGIGSDGTADTIRFSACNIDGGWVDYVQNWKFYGNVIITGDMSSTSDMRLKQRIDDVVFDLKTMAEMPIFTFRWKDGRDGRLHLGSSAQYWEKPAPWLVIGDSSKTLNYAVLGVAGMKSLAVTAVDHETRIKMLERKVNELETENRRYGN